MLKLPEGRTTQGTYPDGTHWKAVMLDQGHVYVVQDHSLHIEFQAGPKGQFKTWPLEMPKDLFNVLKSVERYHYPQLVAWFDSMVTEDMLQTWLSEHYIFCAPSWQKLSKIKPVKSVKDIYDFVHAQGDGLHGLYTWLDSREEYYSDGSCNHSDSLRYVFVMENDSRQYLLLVYRDYLNANNDETALVYDAGDLREILTTDTMVAEMLRNMDSFSQLERRLV